MKKSYVFYLFILLSTPLLAQPVLDQSYFPEVGRTFAGRSFRKTVPIPSIAEGPNQTWNFAGLDSVYILDYNFSFRIKTPANTDSAANFPGASLAYVSYFGTDSIENFQKINGNDLEYLGYNVKGSPLKENFSIPRVDFRKDLGFEESFIRQSTSAQRIGGFVKYQKYHDTLTYAGYGTLITSFGTYQNVVMMRRNFSIDFSFNQAGPFEFGYLGKNWLWYLPGYGLPYVRYAEEIDMLVPDENLIEGYIGFIPPPVANQEVFDHAEIRLVPTLLHAGEELRLEGVQDNLSEIRLVDASGRIRELSVREGQVRLPKVEPGVYSVLIGSGTQQVVRRLAIQ